MKKKLDFNNIRSVYYSMIRKVILTIKGVLTNG